MEIDKSKFKDDRGSYITQSLFIEFNYDVEKAVYTWSDTDKEYKGRVYPSLRRLYLEERDPTEYIFATKYLWGWEHWQRMLNNKLLFEQIKEWREELEVKLRAEAIRNIVIGSNSSFNAAKYVAKGEWDSKPGRPTKEKQAAEKAIRQRVADAVADDASRISHLVRKP